MAVGCRHDGRHFLPSPWPYMPRARHPSRPAIAQQGTASPQTRMWLLPPPRRSLTPAQIRLPPRSLRRIPKLRRTRQAQLRPKPPRPPMPPRMRPPRRPPRLPRTRQTMPPTRTTPPIRPPPSPRQTCKAASPCWRPRSSAWTRTVSSPMSARRPWPCRTRSPRPNRPPCRRWSMRRCMRPRKARPTLWSMCPPTITPARWSFPMQPSSARTPAATISTSTTQTKTSS